MIIETLSLSLSLINKIINFNMNHVVIENSRTLFWQKVQRGKIGDGEGSRFKGQWHRVHNVFVVLGTCQCWMLLHLKKNT